MALITLVVFLTLIQSGVGYWWALGTSGLNVVLPDNIRKTFSSSICNRLTSINEKQKQLCREYPDLLPSIALGAKISIEECKHQFKSSRWNCPINRGSSVFGKILEKATRESAFIHAITSAGLVSAVTEACAQGRSAYCSCDRTYRRSPSSAGWKWGGCSRDVNFGLRYAERFVDATENGRKRSPRKDMNKHNNEAGRKTITQGLYRKCKCHGLSGSCELKTCWLNLPKFRLVGKKLKEKYDSAHEMRIVMKTKKGKPKYKKLKPKYKEYSKPTTLDLIYYEKSPNFCSLDTRLGSAGTSGRECNITSSGFDGCEQMCCGRGYDFKAVIVTKSCNCKFVWCCSVRCQKCTAIRKVYTCR